MTTGVCEADNSRRRLRVLIVTPWYPKTSAPTFGIFVRNHALAVSRFCDVVVIHLDSTTHQQAPPWQIREESDASLSAGVPCYRLIVRSPGHRLLAFPLQLLGALQAAHLLRQRHGHWDIVHAHVFTSTLCALPLTGFGRIPLLLSEHFSIIQRHQLNGLDTLWLRWCCRWAQVVLPVSRTLRQAMRAHGVRANFHVVANPVDGTLFHPAARERREPGVPRILSVGSLLESKGVAILLEALASLPPGCGWHLRIIGDGPDRQRLEALAAALGIEPNLTFHGTAPPAEVAHWMRQADLFVLASLSETFSVATAEALCSGLPVLVSRCGGPEEFVDDSCGRLVDAGDAAAMATGLIEMLDQLEDFDRRAIAARASSRFSERVIGATTTALYRQAIRG